MNFAHSFWSKPLFKNKFERYFSYEHAVKNTVFDYAYSAALVHKFGHTITLYTDKSGIELLNFIPYDKIVEIQIPEYEPMHFAAQPKFYALKQMNVGDILIDGDIFIERKEIFKDIENSNCDLLYSFTENNEIIKHPGLDKDPQIYYDKLLPKFHDTLYKVPTYDELTYPNTSLLQINNQELKDKYIEQYFYHKNLLKDIDLEFTWPDLIIEQYFLWNVSKGYTIKPLIKDFQNLTEREKGFMHLGAKKTVFQNQVRHKLYFLDKELMKNAIRKAQSVLES